MSSERLPIQGEVVRLLETCRGEGAVVAVMPAGAPESHHHFYAGVSRAPALSFLEALLLVLGGDRDEGGRRYEEIVVVNSGRAWSEGELDTPLEEVIRLRSGDATQERGGIWDTWWYRKAPSPEPASPQESDAPGGKPDPKGGLRSDRRRAQYRDLVDDQNGQSIGEANFPLKISNTETGLKFPNRYDELRRIIETLEGRSHRTLLLLEFGVLDYASPALAPHEHVAITDVGFYKMDWFRKWIDARSEKPGFFDVVLYSRNRLRGEAFLGSGLPRRPSGREGAWHAVSYQGDNLLRFEYPCGPFPWGEDVFSENPSFQRRDGTPSDKPDKRLNYGNRTLSSLLRGDGSAQSATRIRFTAARPVPPARPAEGSLIDREFWSGIDVPLLRQALRQKYFAADRNEALGELLDAIEFMGRQAKKITDPVSFHNAVRRRWRRASSIFLWGDGGTGKSYLGELLAELIYGEEEGLLFRCQDSGGGSANDPVSNFRYQFFGPPPGHVGADRLTKVGSHIAGSQGFTVLMIEEANLISPFDFGSSMKVLYGLTHDRSYLPANSALTQDRAVSLWNAIFVLSANLQSFPPPGVDPSDREAITRRMSGYRFNLYDEDAAVEFAQWYLPRAIEESLGGVAICTCESLDRELRRIGLKGRSPDKLRSELEKVVETVTYRLEQAGVSAATCPLVLDVTDALREVLR